MKNGQQKRQYPRKLMKVQISNPHSLREITENMFPLIKKVKEKDSRDQRRDEKNREREKTTPRKLGEQGENENENKIKTLEMLQEYQNQLKQNKQLRIV